MIRNTAPKLTLALAFAVLSIPLGKALAQSGGPASGTPSTTSSPGPTPAGVTGTDPEPQGGIVGSVLSFLYLV